MENNTKIDEYVNSLISGDRNYCSQFANELLHKKTNYLELYETIFKTSLYKVGEMWEYNKISVSTEHLATSITETIINQMYEKVVSHHKVNKKMIAACVENEQHQIGIRMVSDIFEHNGWEAFFLGANVPRHDLLHFIKIHKPDLLALSLSIYFNLPLLKKIIIAIREQFPELPILIGGQAFRFGGTEILTKFDHLLYFTDLYALETYIKKIN